MSRADTKSWISIESKMLDISTKERGESTFATQSKKIRKEATNDKVATRAVQDQ